jgi:hypothetical protein
MNAVRTHSKSDIQAIVDDQDSILLPGNCPQFTGKQIKLPGGGIFLAQLDASCPAVYGFPDHISVRAAA